jgi:hypothetical protein
MSDTGIQVELPRPALNFNSMDKPRLPEYSSGAEDSSGADKLRAAKTKHVETQLPRR